MPRKIGELIADLEAAGFENRGGKGSHRNLTHPRVRRPITIAGKPGDDAKKYQERAVQHAIFGVPVMSPGARYVKIVEWSAEDQCFVGSCPGLLYGGCHGEDEIAVFAELCEIVEETIRLYESEGRELPPATSGHDWANQIAQSAPR